MRMEAGALKTVVTCKECNELEYYGKMRWLNGCCMCRACYRKTWERGSGERYRWDDLDGDVPERGERGR